MKVIGITGGIGSGKSLAARMLEEKHGAYIVNTDRIAKEQMEPGGVSYQPVVDYFGTEILAEDGTIDRRRLSAVIFNDREKLKKINVLTHPNVLIEVKKEIERLDQRGDVPYFVIETALMIESGYDTACDEVWYVHTPSRIRRDRLKKDRGYTDEKINSIFESQSREEDFLKKFPIVIYNDGTIETLEKQIERQLKG